MPPSLLGGKDRPWGRDTAWEELAVVPRVWMESGRHGGKRGCVQDNKHSGLLFQTTPAVLLGCSAQCCSAPSFRTRGSFHVHCLALFIRMMQMQEFLLPAKQARKPNDISDV